MWKASRGIVLSAGLSTGVVLLAVLVGLLTGDDTPESTAVTVGGDVKGAISPGVMLPVDLSFDNSRGGAVALERVTVAVGRIEAPRADADYPCGAGDFAVRQLSDTAVIRLTAGGGGELSTLGVPRKQWPAVGMLNHSVNQDGCKGAVLTLEYVANGVTVHE